MLEGQEGGGWERGGDDRAKSPGKTELQSLHRNPQEKAAGNWLFCLSLKPALKGGGGNSEVGVERGRRKSPVDWCEKGRQPVPGALGLLGDTDLSRCARRRNQRAHM